MDASIAASSLWEKGPTLLRENVEFWPVKSVVKNEKLEGKIEPEGEHAVSQVSFGQTDVVDTLAESSGNNVESSEDEVECSGSKVEKSSNGGFVHPVPQTNLGKGDVILVHDPGPLDEKYTVAEVKEENLSKDGFVWSCTVKYRFSYPQDVIRRLAGGKVMTLKSSVNRLILLLLMEVRARRCQ